MSDDDHDDPFGGASSERIKPGSRSEAVRYEVFMQTEPQVMYAGGFDAVRNNPQHPLHDIYDDLDSLERQYEAIVQLASNDLGDEHFHDHPDYGVQTTLAADLIIEHHRKAVRESKPILSKYDDPNYRYDAPDELDTNVYRHTPEQALRSRVLDQIAPDIAAAGGFPALDRDPNHRRHNSAEGLKKVRQQYDAIVERAEAEFSDTDFLQTADDSSGLGDDFGWGMTGQALRALSEIVRDVQRLTPAELAADRYRAANPARMSAGEIRRLLAEQPLGMRTDDYVHALAKPDTPTRLQSRAREELARREALTDEQRAVETSIRTKYRERLQQVHGRSQSSSEVSL